MRRLWHLIASYPLTAFLATLATVGVVGFELFIPLLTRDAVDVATGQAHGSAASRLLTGYSELTAIIIVMVAVALARFASQFGRRYTAGLLSINVQHRIRVALLDTLQKLDGPGQDRIRVGQVVSRSISDINMIQGLVAMFPLAVGHVLKLVFTVVVMLTLSPMLALVALTSLPLIFFGALASRKPMFAATWAAQQSAADLATHVEETVTGIRVVKAFAQEDREIDRLEEAGRKVYADRMRSARLNAKFQPLVDQLPQLALVANIALGGWLAMTGHITIGTFVAFAAYLSGLTGVARMLSGLVLRINMASSSVSRVFDVLDLRPAHEDPVDPLPVPDGPLGLAFEGVTFSDGGREILRDMKLAAQPGETLALVGPPGSGKTMAVQLMGKFYAPDTGRVALISHEGRLNLKDVTDADLRRALICVFDDSFLYSDTIRQNITMGGSYTQEEIEHAAKAAQAHEFISGLANGYEEVVGERGLTLSGGQRQRIALARALLARPRILVLDDATSAIDATTEARIYQALRDDFADVTIIAVAHRQSTLDLADRVALIEEGHVTASGTFAEMRHNARFSHLMDLGFKVVNEEGLPFDDGTREPAWDELWPDVTSKESMGMNSAAVKAAASMVAGPMGRGGGGGGGRGGMGAGMAAAMPATPELLAQVAKLPPATEQPKVDIHHARTTQEPFRLLPLFRQVRWLILAVMVCLVIGVAVDLTFPTLVRFAIDHGVVKQEPGTLWIISLAGTAIVLIGWVTAIVQTVLTARTGERLLFGLRLRTYAHLNRLSLDYFERTMSGKIMTRMTTDIDALSSFLQTGVAQAIVSLATLLGISGMLLATNMRLALVALAALPILVVATWIFRRISARLYTQAREEISQVNAMFQENISGLRISQMHGMADHSLHAFENQADKYRRTRVASQTAVAVYFPGIGALNELASVAVLGVGALQVQRGELSPGILVAFIMYMGLLFGPIQQLSQLFDGYQQAAVGLTRISELLGTRASVVDKGQRAVGSAARGELALNDVSFAYAPDLPTVTKDFSLSIAPGSTIALVGPTGAGKSTTIKLLSRFYDPLSGTVTASGTDIRQFPLHDWRRTIGLVPQEAHLFSGTVADNIAYGRPGSPQEAITAAARRVGALSAIASIPGGFNHPVGERGRGLSSGQRQLIALARAEMSEPDIMLLDEATATLDPATEATILNASDRVTSTRTSVIVAHRLATAARADRIVVIVDGAIVEDGSHTELLARGGRYADMWNAV
ncbi:Putative multidrug export ATP-binding/permease protein [Corynebacterium kalinowskii]|uniref:Multidrug export ATP-binding/permease protein n=2 Tax=Corynebacterium kalinowskii TaxID=2675216 RepID=A0A6B8VSN2_9CORY|nr:Putative multidrug export ATP-binding/permease protein [Corynebacterium kalinowskii]